jgi:hypothetical protein
MSIFGLCALVVGSGVVVAVYLKREGERSWARHQEMVRAARRREQFRRLGKAFIDVRITLVDNLTPAMRKVAAEMSLLAAAPTVPVADDAGDQ